MSIQIAVRLTEDTVEFIDSMVKSGRASSRAEVVVRALAREQRRERSLQDLELLTKDRVDEFASLRNHVQNHRVIPD